MALLCRIKHVKLNHLLSHYFKRSYIHIALPHRAAACSYHHHYLYKPNHQAFCPRPTDVFNNTVRFFAAPVQVNKVEAKPSPTPVRLNDAIKADFIRLVTDDGHSVVSRNEALQHATALKLDLVEVDRFAQPPVCKIMDYNRERYRQQLKEKERVKSKKSNARVLKGDCKELRFSAKAELKDLKMKADSAKRLMERGYRVKCMVVGTEDQDLEGVLIKVSAMIEDVALVDSGPKVEKKQAYVIVRHVKFGPSKKGSKKLLKIGDTSSATESAAESGMDTDDEVDKPLQGQEETTWLASAANNDASRFVPPIVPNNMDLNVRPTAQIPENRYARNVTKNASGAHPMRYPNHGSQPQSLSNVLPTGGPRQAESEGSPSRSFQHPRNGIPGARGEFPNQAREFEPRSNLSASLGRSGSPSNTGIHTSQSSGFGIDSSAKIDGSGRYGSRVDVDRPSSGFPINDTRNSGPGIMTPSNRSSPAVKPHGNQGSGADDSGKKWGVFSKE